MDEWTDEQMDRWTDGMDKMFGKWAIELVTGSLSFLPTSH